MRHTYPKPEDGALVLSYSAINAFKSCRKKYELSYEQLIEVGSSDAAESGSVFHWIMEYTATQGNPVNEQPAEEYLEPMVQVAHSYLANNPLPEKVLAVEQPIYTKLIRGAWLKTTLDLVYDDSGTVVGRDYKTFNKAPSLDVDLDFQGGIYTAALMRNFGHSRVTFEYEYVRRVPPGTKNSKGVWSVEDCYINVPVIRSRKECDELWAETQDWAREILRARNRGLFMRSGNRKEFGSPCMGCWVSELCKAELQHGQLDDQDIELLARGRRERDILPERYKK